MSATIRHNIGAVLRLQGKGIPAQNTRTLMKTAPGKSAYLTGTKPVTGEGLTYTAAELDAAIKQRVAPLLRDDTGKADVVALLASVATTDFTAGALQAALSGPAPTNDWHAGEALADAYLSDHCDCTFPWPVGRDLRNVSASPAGADLVGFQKHKGAARFAFGEVKTSTDHTCPPNVMSGRHGMTAQLEELRDSTPTKNQLMLYLGHRAINATWQADFVQSAGRLLSDPCDVSLFGVLVRDVPPNELDLKTRTVRLTKSCPATTSIELRSIYLPVGAISTLAAGVVAAHAKGGTN